MKAYLVVLLFALTACSFPDLEKLFLCVIKNPTIPEVLPKVVEAIKNKDISALISLAITNFPKIKKEIIECLDEPVLKGCDYLKLADCIADCGEKGDTWARAACCNQCRKKFC